MNRILQSYLEEFAKDWTLDASDLATTFEHFINFILLSKVSVDRFNPTSITTRDGECGIDGAAILFSDSLVSSAMEAKARFQQKKRDIPVEYIFVQCKTNEDYSRTSLLNFGTAVKDLLHHNRIPQDELLQDIREIHNVVVQHAGKISGGLPKLTMYYAADGKWDKRASEPVLQGTIENIIDDINELGLFEAVSFDVIDMNAIRGLWMATKSPEEATFTVSEMLSIPKIDGVKQAYLTVVAAPEFVDQVLVGADGRIRHSVFEQNVRHFLGDDNDVNSKVIATLLDDEQKGRFAILNNGVTLIAADLRTIGNKQMTVKDFQIVNGCQTSHILFGQRERLDSSVFLAVKVIQVDKPDIVDAIVEATNSQSKVPESQLYATKTHVRALQDYFDARRGGSAEGLYFERRTRQYAGLDVSNIRIVDINLLGKSFAAMFLDQPHLASAYAGQLFGELRNDLFKEEHPPIAYYTAAMAHYRLFLLFNSGDLVDRSYGPCKWHLMMMMKYYVDNILPKHVSEEQVRVEQACNAMLTDLESTRKTALLVKKLIKMIPAAEPGRWEVRKQSFTTDVIEQVRGLRGGRPKRRPKMRD